MEQISLFSLLPRLERKLSPSFNSFIYQGLYVVLVRKSYQRAVQISVGVEGRVRVSCARSTSVKEIKSFLKDHWQWIQKQLKEQEKIRKKYPLKKFCGGELFLFQGKQLQLKYKNVFLKSNGISKKGFYVEKNNLIYLWDKMDDLSMGVLKKELRDFYETTGKKLLQKALDVFSSRMRLVPRSVRMGSQRSLWGSCSSEGAISLNWRLVVAPPEVMNYVVIHELAHLEYLNHSPAFWSLVFRFCPNYRKYERWLGQNTYAADFLLSRSELHGER